MHLKNDTLANILSGAGVIAFLTDIQVILTVCVLLSALILNLKGIFKKDAKDS